MLQKEESITQKARCRVMKRYNASNPNQKHYAKLVMEMDIPIYCINISLLYYQL